MSTIDYLAPLKVNSVKLMQVVQVVLAVTTPEYIDFIVIAVGSVHVARAWRKTLHLEV